MLKTFIESATNQGPHCGILNRRTISHLYQVHHPGRQHLLYSGSMVDGTGHAADGFWMPDTDYMDEVLQVVDESKLRHLDLPGFVWIEMKEGESENQIEFDGSFFLLASALRNVTKGHWIKVRDQFETNFIGIPTKKTKASNVFYLGFGKDSTRQEYLSSITSPNVSIRMTTTPTSFWPFEYNCNNKFDYVKAVHCHFWPKIGEKWIERARRIYTSDEVNDFISYGFHLVPKSLEDGTGNADLDFRLSFSVTEDKIVKGWSDTKWLCYLILKFLLKLRIYQGNVLSTYHMKTLMMWACEQKHKSVWNKDNITNCVIGVMDDLLHAMCERRLPHYFVPQINLFHEVISDEKMKQEMKFVQNLRCKIETASENNPGYHWLCRLLERGCQHHKDQVSFEGAKHIIFASLRFFYDKLTLLIKEAVVRTLDFHKNKKITDKEYEKRELLMNVLIRMLEEKMEFTNQVITLTNYKLSVPPTTIGDTDPYLLTNPGTDDHDYLMELARPQLALEKLANKYFFTTEKCPDDPFYFVTQIVPESVPCFSQTNLLKYKWRTLNELNNAEEIFPFPAYFTSLNEKDQKAWNFMCEAAEVSRMSTGVDEEPMDKEKLSAAAVLEHIFWGSCDYGAQFMNRPIVGGTDQTAVLKPLFNEIIRLTRFEEELD